jgi:hypothetical protein
LDGEPIEVAIAHARNALPFDVIEDALRDGRDPYEALASIELPCVWAMAAGVQVGWGGVGKRKAGCVRRWVRSGWAGRGGGLQGTGRRRE